MNPQNAKNSINENENPEMTRRDFLKMGMGALSAVALLEVGGISLMFMQPRSLEGEFGGVVACGTVDSLCRGR
jgi:hypothetical protein